MKKFDFQVIQKKEEWDDFVQSNERYSFVQSWGYGEVLKTIVDSMERIGVYDRDELVALLPLAVVKAKRGKYLRLWHGPILGSEFQIPYLRAEHFGRQANSKIDSTVDIQYSISTLFKEIIDYLVEYAKVQKLSFIRVQPVVPVDFEVELFEEGFLKAPTHNLDAEHTLQLSLQKFQIPDSLPSQGLRQAGKFQIGTKGYLDELEKTIFLNMRKQTRYYIRRAEKEGVQVEIDNSDFDTFFEILSDTANRQKYTMRPRKYFEKWFEIFKDNGLQLYFASVDGKRVAMAMFLDFGKYRFYVEGGMYPEFSKNFPAYAIQGQSIKDAIQKGIEIYDFWGGVSPKDDDGNVKKDYPWAGIDLFKRGFGGEEVSIVHPHDLPLSIRYWFTWIFETIEKKKRGY